MRSCFKLALLLPLFALALPSNGQEAGEEGPDPKLIEKALSNPYLQGKLISVDREKNLFTIQAVIATKKTINPKGQRRYAELYRRAYNAYRSRNRREYEKVLPQLQAAYASVYSIEETTHNFKLQGTPEFKVRKEKLPDREGDDGKIKPYTAKEKAKLKGDVKLPGYEADPKELDVELKVRVFLKPKKSEEPKTKPAIVIGTAGKTKPKNEMAADAQPITMIMILPAPEFGFVQGGRPGAPPTSANPFEAK